MTHYLFKAAGKGDCQAIEARLDAGDDIEYRHKGTGRTSLVEATIHGNYEAVELLLARGANVDASCEALGYTSVGWAVGQGHHDILTLLIAAGADVNAIGATSSFGYAPVHLAVRDDDLLALVRLLEAGADPLLTTNSGANALDFARERGGAKCAVYLEKIGLAPSPPAPPQETLAWPALTWEPTALQPGDTLPQDVTPEQVVRSYILAMHHWEVTANATVSVGATALSTPTGFESFRAALQTGAGIASIHLTQRSRSPRSSMGWPPDMMPSMDCIEVNHVKPSRCEILVRIPEPQSFNEEYEWLFVCLKKYGQWRIDSAKTRHRHTPKWGPAYIG